MKHRNAYTLIELLITLAIIGIVGALVVGCLGGCSVSDGTRTGTLTKFSRRGIINKSWEGELVLGGVRQGTTKSGTAVGVANVWAFSVLKQDVAEKMENAVGQEVKVKYHEVWVRNPVVRDTPYEIISVEIIGGEPAEKQ